MWEKFHKLCSSDEFRKDWIAFIQSSVGFHGSAIFYQYIAKVILEKMIKFQLPVESASASNTQTPVNLDFEESNALRYCAGYILRAVKKKIDKSAHPLKKELQLCVKDLLESRLR